VDIKRYARVEKVPGGEIEESKVLNGVMVNKVRSSSFLGDSWDPLLRSAPGGA
jgi:hypothetical protein